MRTTFGPAALRDLHGNGEYLMRQNPRAAATFADNIADLAARIALFPDSGLPTSRGTTRVASLRGFPYQVFYRRLGADEARILRVRHARRVPLIRP